MTRLVLNSSLMLFFADEYVILCLREGLSPLSATLVALLQSRRLSLRLSPSAIQPAKLWCCCWTFLFCSSAYHLLTFCIIVYTFTYVNVIMQESVKTPGIRLERICLPARALALSSKRRYENIPQVAVLRSWGGRFRSANHDPVVAFPLSYTP